MRWILLLGILISSFQALAESEEICGNVFFTAGKIKINDNEKTLICGSPDKTEGWREVPLKQAELHLKTILENLGYLKPEFKIENNQLFVTPGPRSEIKDLQVIGADGILDADRKRKVVGEPLMSEKLNEVEAWAQLGIRSQGYACPEILVEAQAWDSTVINRNSLGGKKSFGPINYGDLDGLNGDILDRYQPFSEGDDYDIRKVQLMTSRMLSDGLFQSAYFLTRCQGDQALLDLQTSIGKPKIFRIGIGASTEELPFADFTFRNARLDNKASFFIISLHGSPILQSLTFGSELYFFPGWQRTFLGPRARLARETENSYQFDSAKSGVDIGRNWDLWNWRWSGRWGPTLNYTKTIRGVGPDNATFPTIDGSLSVMSHVYESNLSQQFEGWSASLLYRGQGTGLGSKADINRYEVNSKVLWNIQSYSPPLVVLGTRVQAITIDATEIDKEADLELIPVDERIYAGGDENLRGFPRKSLNNNGRGYLSQLYLGLELRLIEELPYRLQPFLLWDGAQLGQRRYTVDTPVFISEGLGLRWASPFGTLRGSAARGRILHQDQLQLSYPEQWVFFLSFGREF